MMTQERLKKSTEHVVGDWRITAVHSHILKSEGADRELYETTLAPLPHLPEMVFDANHVTLEHIPSGAKLDFNALDALRGVDPHRSSVTVAAAVEWQSARQDVECVSAGETARPYDWTFTTEYRGSVGDGSSDSSPALRIEATEDKIDIEKLKKKEKIEYFADVNLFEDELGDNGCSLLNVKLRAMPTSFLLLQRFYLRVDDRMVRVYDTRIHYEAGNNFILREFRKKESQWADIKTKDHRVIYNVMEVDQYLQTKSEMTEKLFVPN